MGINCFINKLLILSCPVLCFDLILKQVEITSLSFVGVKKKESGMLRSSMCSRGSCQQRGSCWMVLSSALVEHGCAEEMAWKEIEFS